MGSIEIKLDGLNERAPLAIWKAWLPYILVAGLLVLSRVSPDLKAFLTGLAWKTGDILGEKGITESVAPLYLPSGDLGFCGIADVLYPQHAYLGTESRHR